MALNLMREGKECRSTHLKKYLLISKSASVPGVVKSRYVYRKSVSYFTSAGSS